MMDPAVSHGQGFRCLTKDDIKKLSLSQVPIPVNEAARIFTLRQTELLDSDTSDPSFDRFVSLAQRMFGVPIALVSLVDIDRQWFKSNIGLEHVAQTHRDLAFCSYTILPDSPDVFVIEDAELDYRFKDNVLVISDPHIRFYAGAVLTVDNIKIGSLCIIDRVPHIGFTEKERMNLLDLGAAISNLIRERKDALLRSNKECAKMMNDMMQNVRTPLISIASSTRMLLNDAKNRDTQFSKLVFKADNKSGLLMLDADKSLGKSFEDIEIGMCSKMSSLQDAVGQLKVIVESSICLGDFVVEKAESEEKQWASFTSANIFNTIQTARDTLTHLDSFAGISWEIDSSELSKGCRHVCSPKAITFVLLNSVEQLAGYWKSIRVRVSFQDTVDAEYDCIVQQLDEAPICDIESTWQQGLLRIEFILSGKRNDDFDDENCPPPQGYLSFYSLQQVLKDVEGVCTKLDTGSSYEQVMTVSMPCAIIVTEIEKEKGNEHNSYLHSDQLGYQPDPWKPDSKELPVQVPVPGLIPGLVLSDMNNMESCLLMNPANFETMSEDEMMHNQCSGATKKKSVAIGALEPIPGIAPASALSAIVKRNTLENDVFIRKLSVLLIEDTISQQKLMGKWLNGQGCEVTFAINGKIGLELLKIRQFDVCFIDFLMPVMTGAECIKRLRDWCKEKGHAQCGDSRIVNYDLWVNKEMMIVGLSASARDDELKKAFENGMHFFCPKPVETCMLASILKMIRKAPSLQAALTDIGEQAVNVDSARIMTESSLSQSKAQLMQKHQDASACWTDEPKGVCTGESSDVVVCRGNTGWRLFKHITRLLSGDKPSSPEISKFDEDSPSHK